MSGLFDKRADGSARRQARTQKETSAKRKTRIITVSVVTVVALLFVSALFINSNFIRRTLPAITIGNVSFTATELDYFYKLAIFEYENLVTSQMGDAAAGMLPNPQRLLSSQIYNHETGETWADFFTQMAIGNLSELVKLHDAATAAGFVLSAEDRADIDHQVASLVFESEMQFNADPRRFPGPLSFMQEIYGPSINESSLRDILTFINIALAHSEAVRDAFQYDESVLEAYYYANRDTLDVFRYRTFLIHPEFVDRLDFDTAAEFEEAQEEGLLMASMLAELVAMSVETQEEFNDAAREHDAEMYADDRIMLREQMGDILDVNFREWLRDESRTYGDVTSIDVSFGSYVLFFIERDENDYYLTAMRQILFMRDMIDPFDFFDGEDDPDYIAAFEAADMEARAIADSVFASFQAGGSTEDVLLSLMAEYSDDPTEGGFYDELARYRFEGDRIAVMRVVPELEDWLFDDSREPGNSDLIQTEAFGYHLMYFMGHGDQLFRHIIAADRMRAVDHLEWMTDLPDVEARRHWTFVLTQP